MSYQWLRLWTDAIDDEKLKLLAFEDRWHFIAVLCMKRKGILDAPDAAQMRDRKVGAKLGLGDRDRDEVRNRLREVGLIDESWQPLAWGKRQFVSDADPTASERKRKQRDKERHAPVTRDDRDSHERVTPESRPSDSDTDSDKSKRGAKRARRVPEVFQPDLEYAKAQIPDIDASREAQKFRDWEFKTARSDWPAAWRTWVGNCRDTGRYAKQETTQWR